jgi:hypothetical protein
MLLGVTGRARVGKDTFGRHLVENYSFEHAYFAKPLKNMLTALGFPESQYQTTEEKEAVIPDLGRSYRYLAQTIGTEWGRNLIHPDIWLLMMARKWNRLVALNDEFARMVITDVRFENEAAWVREAGGIVVHITSELDRSGMKSTAGHVSEKGVGFVQSSGTYPGDRIVFNNYEAPTEDTLKAFHGSIDALLNGLLPKSQVL